MANRFFNPNQQFEDATGLPYAGGSLAFYASGTSTPLNTYSDSALSIANPNPVVLDSAGRAGSVFLQNLAYKVVLSDVNNNQIWTEDPVYASDYSTRAKFTSGSGSPNGSVAGTAGSAGIGADAYWDATNFILYICTQTGNAATAVWTAVNASTAAAVVPLPQGYLTPTSGTPIITSDVSGGTSLVYTPYVGNTVPIFSGSGFNPTVFSELTLTLTSSQAANTLYDVFIFNNSSVLTLVTGPAWTASTAGSSVRGTGAGTTQISRLSGLWVNTVQITGRNGANTYTIPANQATYLGTIYIDSAAGQITLTRAYGQSRKWSIWNAYNRVPICLSAGNSTASWTTSNNTPHQQSANDFATMVYGLAEEIVTISYEQKFGVSTNVDSGGWGIGWNATNAYSGQQGFCSPGVSPFTLNGMMANYVAIPSLGRNDANLLQNATGTGITYTGAQLNCQMLATYRG